MKKEKENVRSTDGNSSKRGQSRYGKFVTTKRKRIVATPIVESVDAIANDIDAINSIVGVDTFDADNGIIGENSDVGSGSGSSDGREGRGRDGRGRDGSGRDRSDSSDSNTGKRTRRSRTAIIEEIRSELDISLDEATKIYESQRAPRKVKNADLLPDGVEASVMLLSTVFEGGAELLAMASGRDYFKLQKQEGNALSKATLDLMNSWPSSVRKRFDKLMRIYVPYWNLAKVITAVTYPRYQIFQMEKEMQNGFAQQAKEQNDRQAKSGDATTASGTSTASENSIDDAAFQV